MLQNRLQDAETEDAELQRFNQTIAAVLLGLGSLIVWSTGHWVGWVLTGMVSVAAGVALVGFCIGCVLYFQLKKLRHKWS